MILFFPFIKIEILLIVILTQLGRVLVTIVGGKVFKAQLDLQIVKENIRNIAVRHLHGCYYYFWLQALTKFLKCVDWSQPQEARQVSRILV